MWWVLIGLALVGTHAIAYTLGQRFMGYRHGWKTGYRAGQLDERTQWTQGGGIRPLAVVRRLHFPSEGAPRHD